ncbi:MAG: FtsQ-type POTRA domain-containing protein [Deltaproteobacteria bacterium]|nr:MAG: FtsQ-type POTRA domain-containing protein [Deltaproteobacteria bacterium]
MTVARRLRTAARATSRATLRLVRATSRSSTRLVRAGRRGVQRAAWRIRRRARILGRWSRRAMGAVVRGTRYAAYAAIARWRTATALAALVAVAGVGFVERAPLADWALHHPYFAVSEIVVAPTHHVRQGALLQWMGLRPGMSIWSLEPRALERRLEEHPWIRRAHVERQFPRRLTVQVVEREAAAVLLIDQLYYVDRSGAVFARVGSADALDLPFVTGIEAAVLNGERSYPRHAVRQALRLVQLMGAAGLPFRVSEVHIERDEGVTVFPVEPKVALEFGWGRYPEKLARLGEVLAGYRGRESQLREIDLTYDSQVVVRLRQGGSGHGDGRRVRA